jgi:hypothetical protein
MKTVIIAVCILLFTSPEIAAQKRTTQDLQGVWEAMGKNKSGGLQFVDSTKIYLVYGTHKMQVIQWHADFSKTPAWIDFTVEDSTREIRLKSLLQFIDDDLIQWQIFYEGARPVIFASGRGDMVYLRKMR